MAREKQIRKAWLGMVLLPWMLCAPGLISQAQQGKPSDENPFPGEPAKTPAATTPDGKPQEAKPQAPKPDAPKPGGDSDNPFPGESSDAPIIPVDQIPGQGPGQGQGQASPKHTQAEDGGKADSGDPDGDPVKSPDGTGTAAADDGFSSSHSGLRQVPTEDDPEEKPGKGAKKKTREQVLKEDVDVGNFYLDRKNWKAAQGRFEAAYALNPENPDAVWGLAEAERHLNLNDKAREHYQLFMTYDPEGPHGKAARKALEQLGTGGSASLTPK